MNRLDPRDAECHRHRRYDSPGVVLPLERRKDREAPAAVAENRRHASSGCGGQRIWARRPARLRVPVDLRQDVGGQGRGDGRAGDSALIPCQDPGTWHSDHCKGHVIGGAARADRDHRACGGDERARGTADETFTRDAQLAMRERQNPRCPAPANTIGVCGATWTRRRTNSRPASSRHSPSAVSRSAMTTAAAPAAAVMSVEPVTRTSKASIGPDCTMSSAFPVATVPLTPTSRTSRAHPRRARASAVVAPISPAPMITTLCIAAIYYGHRHRTVA